MNRVIRNPSLIETLTLNAFFLRDAATALATAHRQYGRVVKLRLGPIDTTLLVGPEANRLLFRGPETVQAGPVWKRILPFLDGALLTSDGISHSEQRRLLQPLYRLSAVESSIPSFLETVRERTSVWTKSISLYTEMQHIALTNATRILLGYRLSPERYHQVFMWHRDIAAMILGVPGMDWVPGTRRWRGTRAQQQMWSLAKDIIAERGDDTGEDALGTLLAHFRSGHGHFDQRRLLLHVFTLFAAGHATMAALLTFAIAALLARPELMARALAEQNDVLGKNPPDGRAIARLDFTRRLICEVERMYTPLPWIARTAIRPLELDGYSLASGSTLLGGLWLSHKIPSIFHEPDRFDPDRYLPPRSEPALGPAHAAYGGGPHMCPGMNFARVQAAVTIHALIRHVKFSNVQPLRMPTVSFRPFAVPAEPLLAAVSGVNRWSW
jgi:cytochrome P450